MHSGQSQGENGGEKKETVTGPDPCCRLLKSEHDLGWDRLSRSKKRNVVTFVRVYILFNVSGSFT